MTDERWQRVKALFQAAVERPAGERGAFLAAATGDDEALRAEVESLLASDAGEVGFLDRFPLAATAVPRDSQIGATLALQASLPRYHRIGPYEIVAPIGAGSMGEVYRARDTKLNRDVAVKVLPDLFAADPERLGRFEREAQLLASLNHPHIAQIYGFEESPTGHSAVRALVEILGRD